jgi:hypothetical protein
LFLIFPDVGGFQMGPRYWFDGFIAMHLAASSLLIPNCHSKLRQLGIATWRA